MKKEYLECGKIINTHGIAGAVKLDPWCDSPEVLANLKRVFIKKGETVFSSGYSYRNSVALLNHAVIVGGAADKA